MVIAPSHYSLRTFPFVDRVKCKKIFQNFIETSEQKQYNVLHFYGISGIGKSKLQQELQSILTEENQDSIWANVDFKVKNHREIGTFLFSLRSQLAGKYKIKFDYFDIAHAVYWKKVNPAIALSKEKYSPIEEGNTVDIIIKVLNTFGPFSLLVDIPNYLVHAPERLEQWWIEGGLGFANKLNESKPNEIEQLLPVFFFTDLQAYLKNESKKAVIFIDTYEALWEEARKRGNFNSKDEGIRGIIAKFEYVSWVICGRDKLRWNEVNEEWNNYLKQHEIGVLPHEYCIKFLESHSVHDEEIQSIILETSKGYPYYLALSVDTYLTIKEKGYEPGPEDFSKNQEEIFNSFFHYLDEAERSTLLILSNLNFWDRSLLNLLTEEFGTNYPKSEMAFNELHWFSFIVRNSDVTWSMHPLMRNSLQENQKTEQKEKVHKYLFNYYDKQLNGIDIKKIEEMHKTALNEAFYHGKQFMEVEVLFSWFSEKSEVFNKAAFWDFLIPLSDTILNILEEKLSCEHLDVATGLNNLAELYRHMGKYEEALPLHERALEIREKTLGSEHPDVAASLNNLALLYESMGKYEEALPVYQRSLATREKTLGSEHPDVATSLNNLASLYELMGEYKEALPTYQRSLEILKKMLGFEHPDIATNLNNLAELHRKTGKYDEALQLHKDALDIREKTLGLEHPDVATSFNNLALLYHSMGKYEKALDLYQQALEIRKKKLGSEHPDVAISLNSLAELYYSMGKYDEALQLHKDALDIREKTLGFEHPDVATSLSSFAAFQLHMVKYDESLNLIDCALKIREKKLGSEHPDVATSLSNLAVLYDLIGKYDEALPLLERSLAIREKTLGPEHPDVAASFNNLAGFYLHMGKYQEASPLYKLALDLREKTLGSEHPDVAISLNNLAVLYKLMGKYDEALPLYERALKINEKTLGKDHPTYKIVMNRFIFLLNKIERALETREKRFCSNNLNVATNLNNLAVFYLHMEEYEEASDLYERSLAILEKTLGPEHPDYIAVKDSLNSLLLKMGK